MPEIKAPKVLPPGWGVAAVVANHASACSPVNPYQREMMLNLDIEDLPRDWYGSSCLAYLHDEV
jgi:hypothetical protein